MTNLRLAQNTLEKLASAGVRELILCAGARNAPLVSLLSKAESVKTYSFFDERAAGFFALGRMQASGRPVAVVTTSGTAAAEVLPAVIEADYQGQPLVIVTADRPRRYRGSGAPQTIVQPGIYSCYVEKTLDLEGEQGGDWTWTRRRPLHVNLCFDEPLLDEELKPWQWPAVANFANEPRTTSSSHALAGFHKPLVIVSGLPAERIEFVKNRLRTWERPLYLEGPSGLRGAPELADFEIRGGEKVLPRLDFDCVVRVGSVPTLRFWRDLENADVPVFHFSHLPFSGLPRASTIEALETLPEGGAFAPFARAASEWEQRYEMRLAQSLERFPLSEAGWVRWLSRQLPLGARLFVGNSLPIREWDLAADSSARPRFFCNRGVNGIDGLISTFLGTCENGASNWALIGDLSALYDLSAPWALAQQPIADVSLVVMNNGGGKIFERIFSNSLFENRHSMHFADWARMWNWDYLCLQEAQTELSRAERPRLIEIVPDVASTQEFWRSFERVEG